MKGHLVHLMEYDHWANDRVLGALRIAAQAPEKARLLLCHIVAAQDVWLGRVQPLHPAGWAIWEPMDLETCARGMGMAFRAWIAFLQSVSEEEIKTPRRYTNLAGTPCESSLKEMVTHVSNHGTYHRGQIMVVLREAGIEPVSTDYIQYARTAPKKPAAAS